MIKAQGLTKYYGTTRAIEDVSFEVPKGEVLGFLGPNAAGKTTTMRILTCYTPPNRGSATVGGYDVLSNSLEVRRIVGYMPETVPLYEDMVVRSYLDFVTQVKGVPRSRRRAMVEEVMEEVGLVEVAGRLCGNLSKGFRQRVGLAQTLIGEPEVLILDEPTVGLDPRQTIEIRRLIKSLAGKKTVILCSHILPEVSMTCSRVVIINEGRIVAQGTPEHLVSELQTTLQSRAVVRGSLEHLEGVLRQLPGIIKVSLNRTSECEGEFTIHYEKGSELRAQVARTIFDAGGELLEFSTLGMSLEDIFIKVITQETLTGV